MTAELLHRLSKDGARLDRQPEASHWDAAEETEPPAASRQSKHKRLIERAGMQGEPAGGRSLPQRQYHND
jgi:hypothetical protein